MERESINIYDLPQIEGIKNFLVDQIHEKVFPYMRKQGLFQGDDSEILNRVREFLNRAEHLPDLYMNSEESGSEKCYEEINVVPISSKHTAAEHLVKHARALISHADFFPVRKR